MKKIQIILYSLYSIFLLALLLLQNYFGNSLRSLLASFDLRIVIYSQFILFGAAVYSEKIFSSRTSRNQRIVPIIFINSKFLFLRIKPTNP